MTESTFDRPHNREMAQHRHPLCNAFGVWDGWIVRPPRVRRERRPRRIAATLGYGIQPLRGKEPMARRPVPYTERHTQWFLYAEGVTSHSPGSRRGQAAKRTLGHGPHNTFIPRRGFTNAATTFDRRHDHEMAQHRHPLCNAFGVWDGWIVRPPRVRRERRPRRIAATLGYGIQPLRGKEPMARRPVPYTERHTQWFLYAEGVSPHSPGSRRGKDAKRTLGHGSHDTRIYPEGVLQMTTLNPKHNVRRSRYRICDISGGTRPGTSPSYDVPLGWQCTV